MKKKFRKNSIKKHMLLYCISTLSLLTLPGALTACGSDPAPTATTVSGTDTTETLSERSAEPLPSEEHLRAFDIVQDIHSEDFSPISADAVPLNSYTDLSVPTYATEIDGIWFIVDCYHDQVIYHDNLSDPLTDWQVLTNEIDKGHTIASDGLVYLVDDTERNRILVFEKKDGVFYHTQTLEDIGNRPHYIRYDAPSAAFYVWSSMSGEMFLCRHDPDDPHMYLTRHISVHPLSEQDTYVRSFTIDGDDIYFVSGIPGSPAILQADLRTFAVKETYPVPDELAGMVQLTIAEGSYYITVSTDIAGNQDLATMIRTDDLAKLAAGDYEDVYANFIGGGTPYYITLIDNDYYLTEHRIPGHGLWRFQITKEGIKNVEAVY